MHIREIHLQQFMSHADTTVRLPARGVVLVTGKNGLGKSALFVESVAAGCFGKTLRGTPPWNGEESRVRVQTDIVEVERTRSGKKPVQLSWNPPGKRPTKYDTTSKAQDALASLVGNFDVWKRTTVFSSADAAHFSLASDKERKVLLETLLGLDRFDPALAAARNDLRDARTKHQALIAKAEKVKETIKGLKARLKDLDEADEDEANVIAPRVPQEKQSKMRKLEGELLMQLARLEQDQKQRVRECAAAEAELKQAQRERAHLDHDSCPTCTQPIPEAQRAKLRATVTEREKTFETLRKQRAEADAEVVQEMDALRDELTGIRAFVANAAEVERAHVQLDAQRSRRQEKREQLQAELETTLSAFDEAMDKVGLMRVEVSQLEVVEQVLGLKGVRAHLLDEAMEAVTKLANAWLARLFPGVEIDLVEENDKIALNVLGLEHEHGYAANSSGQRRRIDIALLLALSDLEAASRGVERGTLVLDEVADTLDKEGVLAFTEVLGELSQDRCVVVISHSPELAESLTPAVHFEVGEGHVHIVE